MTTDTYIVRNKQGQIVGRIEDRIFIKEVHGHIHMLRKPIAWAIDRDIFNLVIAPNCFSMLIVDKDTNKKYICGVETFKEKRQRLNRKFGEQYYLELVHWKVQ